MPFCHPVNTVKELKVNDQDSHDWSCMWQCWSVVEVGLYCVDKDEMFHDRVRNGCYMAVTQLRLREKGGTAPNFWPMSVVAKRLDGSRCHLV